MGERRTQQDIENQIAMARLNAMRTNQTSGVYGAVQPDKFTPESLATFEKSGKYSDLRLRNIGTQYGRYNPGDFTTDSWAAFVQSGDPSNLVRYVTPQNASVNQIAGGYELIQPDKTGGPPRRTVLSTPQTEFDAASRLAESRAAGQAAGEAAGAQGAKAPSLASLEYVTREFRDQFARTMQGRVAGPSGWIFDYGDKKRFDNLREQLSTEVRTAFRIPGEGTLSDREQAQYGLQLPDTSNPPEVNEAILRDIENRVRLRVTTPITSPSAPHRPAQPHETAAQRAKRLGL